MDRLLSQGFHSFHKPPQVSNCLKRLLLQGFHRFPALHAKKTLNLRLCFELEAVAEAYEERAAILEFDAGMSRQDAEHLARRLTGYEGA